MNMTHIKNLNLKRYGYIIFFHCFFYHSNGVAEDDFAFFEDIPSTLNIAYSFDETDTKATLLNLNLSVFDGQRILLSAGTTTSSETDGLNTTNYSVGLGSNPLNRILTGFRYDFWGNVEQMVIRTFQGNAGFQATNWAIFIKPELKSIVIEANTNINTSRKLELHSPGLDILINYSGFEQWYFALSMHHNDYSRNITLLNNFRFSQLFSPNTLSLASGLYKNRMVASISYYYSNLVLGGNYYRYQSGITSEIAQLTDLNISIEIKKISISYLIGWQINETQQDRNIYHNIGLAYYW